MLCNIFLSLLSVPLICCAASNKNKQNVLEISSASLKAQFDPSVFKKDLFFSEKDQKEFIQSTLDSCSSSNSTFEEAWQCFIDEINPLKVNFDQLIQSHSMLTVNSDSFDTSNQYLDSLFDRGSIWDFQEGLKDIANAMNHFIQACNEITPIDKQAFALKAKDFVAKFPQSSPDLKRRFYLNPQTLSEILSERMEKNTKNSPNHIQRLIRIRPQNLPAYLERAKVLQHKLNQKFLVLFDPRVQIPENCVNLVNANLPGFKKGSTEEIISWLINQMLGIVDYCESNGTVFDSVKVEEWKSDFPQDFKVRPVKFRDSNHLGRSIGAFVLLCIAVVSGIFIYKRKRKNSNKLLI